MGRRKDKSRGKSRAKGKGNRGKAAGHRKEKLGQRPPEMETGGIFEDPPLDEYQDDGDDNDDYEDSYDYQPADGEGDPDTDYIEL